MDDIEIDEVATPALDDPVLIRGSRASATWGSSRPNTC